MTPHRALTLATLLLVIGTTTPAMAAPVTDVSTWTGTSYPGDGSIFTDPAVWDFDAETASITQVSNGAPAFFVAPGNAAGSRIFATVQTPSDDDDFFGFAFGFSAEDVGSAEADFLLMDWKQAAQTWDWFGGDGPATGQKGLAVSRVTGTPTFDEFWGHIDQAVTPAASVEELARGATLGEAGWEDEAAYDFVFEFTTEQLTVSVNGNLEVSLTGDFSDGPFSIYNFSQPGITVSNLAFESLNAPPEVVPAPDVMGDEGELGATAGSFTDPDGDSLDLGCVGPCAGFVDNEDGTWSWSQQLVEGPGAYSVTVTASDGAHAVADTFEVTVHNVAPVITSASSLPSTSILGSTVAIAVDFVDVGVEDTHTALVEWGDGHSSSAAVVEVPGSGSASADHTYSEPGLYVVMVTVWDDDGGADSEVLGEVFVVDPQTFVTGGGWVASPVGAWIQAPELGGKATVGFVVRYRRSGTIAGNLEFQLHNGLNLHAASFDYLLIADGVAEFAGYGTLNGVPGYRFEVVATDERLAGSADDLFWITVIHDGEVVYDDGVYPPQGLPVRGLGIQIHVPR